MGLVFPGHQDPAAIERPEACQTGSRSRAEQWCGGVGDSRIENGGILEVIGKKKNTAFCVEIDDGQNVVFIRSRVPNDAPRLCRIYIAIAARAVYLAHFPMYFGIHSEDNAKHRQNPA